MNKTVAITIASTATAAVMALPTAPAQAIESDTRRCVTQHELWHTVEDFTRRQVERRWDTEDKGVEAYVPYLGRVWLYPMCDRPALALARFTDRRLTAVGIFNEAN